MKYFRNLLRTTSEWCDSIILNGLEGRLNLAGVGGYGEIPQTANSYMTRSAGQGIKGKERHPGRVKKGIMLPGYDPKRDNLRDFIRTNYELSGGELNRILKWLGGKEKGRAMTYLSKRRKKGT